MKRRLLAFLLASVMTFSLVPVNAFALESSGAEVTASAEAVKTEAAKTTAEPAALLADDEVPVAEQAEEDIVYTASLAKNEGEKDNLAVGDTFGHAYTFSASGTADVESFWGTFRFNPETTEFSWIQDPGIGAELDAEQGILRVGGYSGTLPAGNYSFDVQFVTKALGDATVTLESFKVNDVDYLSKPIAVTRTVGCNVSWTEDAAYTVTGEKLVAVGSNYSFTVAANEGYDATNMVVKVNGNEVAGTDGSYTVENVSSDLTITVEGVTEAVQETAGLSVLKFGDTSTEAKAQMFQLIPVFDPAVKEYTVLVPDNSNMFYAWATKADDRSGSTTITAKWTNLNNNKATTKTLTSGKAGGESLAGFAPTGTKVNTMTVTVVDGDFKDEYKLTSVRVAPSLTALSLDGIRFAESFSAAKMAYTATTANESVTVAATPRDESYTVTVNGGSDTTVPLNLGENKIDVVVTNPGGYTNTYTITVTRLAAIEVGFTVDPADAKVTVWDSNKERIAPTDGKYSVMADAEYTYLVQSDGYVSQKSTFKFSESSTIDITLAVATENPNLDKSITAEWGNFRKGDNNLGITDAKTPYAPEDAELLWAVKYGTGWAAAPGSPIMVDGDIYTYSGSTIRRLDSMTGEVVTEGTMVASSSYSIVPMTYADGMVFVGLSGGRIQAFNAKTLESLWVYTDELGGQPNCPITYKDGYIYAGFWNSEDRNANFACINTVDEDHASTTEAKYASWTYTRQGGFYWAGAYVTDKLAIVGTDDGAGGYNTNGAALLVFDRFTGEKLDAHEGIRGDLRSNVSHDPESDRVFFTTKGGILGNAQIDWDTGKILDYKEVVIKDAQGNANAMSTCTPSVYNGRIYIGVAGTSQFTANSGHGIAVYNLNGDGSMTQAYVYAIVGYPQTSAMVSTAYSAEDGSVYIYLPYNYTPGGVSVLKDKPGQTAPVTTTGSGYSEVFTPVGPLAQYCICSTIADQYGTIYYKNDSCYMMAITSKILSLEITQYPTITENEDGSITVDGLKAVTKLKNGEERDVSNYVSVVKNEETGGYIASYTYGFDNANYGLKTLTADITNYTVTIPESAAYTVEGEKTAHGGKDYTFTVTVTEGYDAANMVVKVNGEEVTAVDGVYTVEKVSSNLEITVKGVSLKDATYAISFTKEADGKDNLAVGEEFTNLYTFAVNKNAAFKTFWATFKYDPAVISQDWVVADGMKLEYVEDHENGILKVGGTNDSVSGEYPFEIIFTAKALGDATVTLESVVMDGESILAEPIAVTRTVGYKVNWTEDEAYTVTGEKYAPVGGTYTFTVAANGGYNASNAVVKVNDEVVTAVDGKYTVENVSSNLTITVEGVKEIAYTLTFAGMSGAGDNVALNAAFEGVFSITADCDAPYKTFSAAFKFDPAVVSVTYVRPAIFQQSVDTENGILTLTSKDSSFPANQKGEIMIGFKSIAFGDATVTLTSAKVNEKEVLSAPIALSKAAGYKVNWTENAAYTITGEKYADVDGTYTFTVAANEGYDGSNMVVKVNDTEVTAVDGKYTAEKVSSDLTITVEGVKVIGLKSLSFGGTGTYGSAKKYTMTPAFDPAVKEYTILVPDNVNTIYAWATRGEALTSKAKINVTWTRLSDNSARSARITSGASSGCTLSGYVTAGDTGNTLTITVTQGDSSDVYTIHAVRIDPSLTKLALDGVKINESFSATKKTYTAITTKDSVTVLATPRDESYTVTYNGETGNVIPLTNGENTIEIVVTNKGGYTNSYTLTVTKAEHSVTIPTDESCIITGEEAVMDGADYTFKVEVDYRYEAGEDFAVKVNGETVTGEKGVYTVKNVTTNLVITVEGVTKKVLKPVTVYFSFSHDDKFESCEQSGQVMALKEVTVPYFDLALYGLEDFYFSSEDYGPASGDPTGGPGSKLDPGTKEYAYGKITMFHLFIYATEVYYLGVDPADAGKGYLKDNGLGTSIFNVTGSTGSTFLQEIWNYDLNLNYYLNNEYPLASAGWGSTSDQILLHDGDVVTLGHFTDWSFYSDSGAVFNHIETDIADPVQGDKVTMKIYRDGADMMGTYNTAHTLRTNCPDVYCTLANNVTTGDVTQWTKVGTADENGTLVVDTSTLTPGEYIFSIPGQYGNENPDVIVGSPGGIRLTIHEKPAVKGDIDGDGVIDVNDVMALFGAINSGDDLDAAIADVNGDGVVDTFDVMALYEIIKSND